MNIIEKLGMRNPMENELLTTEELTAEVQAIHDIDIQCSEKEDISHEEALEILGKADRFWR